MKQNVDFYDFRNAFDNSQYKNNFTYKGLSVLFDYLEQLGEDCELSYDMDIVAICCDYSELSKEDILSDYSTYFEDIEDNDNIDIENILSDYTTVLKIDDETFIIGAF